MYVHDLSITIGPDTPIYPGDPPYQMRHVRQLPQDLCTVSALMIGTHCGTHVDVPLHFLEKGETTETMAIETFVGQALIVSVPKNRGEAVKVEEIEAVELNSGQILIVATGWERYAGTPAFFDDFPAFEPNVAEYLVNKRIKALGTDCPSVDRQLPALTHQTLFKHNIGIIEALVNLKPLYGQSVFFNAAPLKFQNCDGSPVRAIAVTFGTDLGQEFPRHYRHVSQRN